jgi:hypothetical protein
MSDPHEFDRDPEEWRKRYWGDAGPTDAKAAQPNGADNTGWDAPDMGVVGLRRRSPPRLPIEVFGDNWARWITEAATAAVCPVDYVALPLLASASSLIGNARWAQATPGWKEPPHLWMVAVGDSGEGKSPGSDCIMSSVVPELERRMVGDFVERRDEWRMAVKLDKLAERQWEDAVRAAQKSGAPLPEQPRPTASEIEPQQPRLRQNDVTVEQVAAVLSDAAPKGLMVVRDEIAGWIAGMNAYNPAGRAFWIEAYGGRPYRVERRKHGTKPIDIPHLAVSVSGGTQPERLAQLIAGADDGLLSRIQWAWPDPVAFELGQETPGAVWAIDALDRLRELDLQPGDTPGFPSRPVLVPLTGQGQQLIGEFGREIQARRDNASGLLRSTYGKARGAALRLSLILEELWWCGRAGLTLPPDHITPRAFAAAATMVNDYFLPMAERVFGDAAASNTERIAATLARWIIKERPTEVHVRFLLREARLPGLRAAEQIKAAADALVEADWLHPPVKGTAFQQRGRVVYVVNPKLYGV